MYAGADMLFHFIFYSLLYSDF